MRLTSKILQNIIFNTVFEISTIILSLTMLMNYLRGFSDTFVN